MRRIASVFSKRSSRSEPTTSPDDPPKDDPSKPITPRRPVRHPTLPQLVSDSAKSCSSTSSASTTLPATPVDEVIPRRPTRKASWKSWLGRRNTPEAELENPPPIPPLPQSATSPAGEYSASLSDVDSLHCHASRMAAVNQARENLRVMTVNKLRPVVSVPPLIQAVDSGIVTYPRSCRLWGEAPKVETLRMSMLRKKLADRLASVHLSPADASLIVTLANRTSNSVKPIGSPLPNPSDISYPAPKSIAHSSQGLHRWIDRPCYEERVLLYLPDNASGGLTAHRVPGSHLGVPELDFSDSLQLLAGVTYDNPQPDQPTPPSQQPPHVPSPPASIFPSDASYFPHSPPTMPAIIPQSPDPVSPQPDPAKMPSTISAPKRGVRFAEDDKEDQIPLGYVLRIKQRREEKARFLQQEKVRRDKEDAERLKREERTRQEAEQLRFERDQERQRQAQIDEARRKQSWAEEVKATRFRRESARAGHPSSPAPSNTERSRSTSRDPSRRRSQPQNQSQSPHSTQRRAPEVSPSPPIPQHSSSSHSLAGSIRNSRPPSVYSSYTNSSEDIRSRDSGRFNKRNTIGVDPMMVQYPMWNGPPVPPMMPMMPMPHASPYMSHTPMGTPIPTFPSVPVFAPLDMPLLPPSAPFMMGQSSRRNSSSSLSSNSPSNRNLHHVSHGGNYEGGHSGNRSSNSNYSGHHRRPSNDSSFTSSRGDSPHSGSLTDLHERRPSAPRRLSSQIPPSSQQTRNHLSTLPRTQALPLNGYNRQSASPYFQHPGNRRQSTIA
ncbi:hypothetical protein CONPUDRAFT_164761 [Coniophora puteana RWD-64-598 SS2]|uniref:Uncharacterized protein n=1 Tax=Coniophora puteana (strain RWD-64-598) TaxID=741705 RepID=A0A5M3MSP2_CONPW|nr:uncharacterized protein CONPUDRAFT_164761 [Coniophora puteana RWD-64-598 SS2]EIW82116.1 hypothetical protein CONPUDRAFT_164761 [Coniophora puteana RWD-64-598 SS2]